MNKELTPKEVGEKLGISIKTVNNYLNSGKMAGYKIGGRWRIPTKSVEEFLLQSNFKIIGGITHE
jgi:excisionase family DNA binding protein